MYQTGWYIEKPVIRFIRAFTKLGYIMDASCPGARYLRTSVYRSCAICPLTRPV